MWSLSFSSADDDAQSGYFERLNGHHGPTVPVAMIATSSLTRWFRRLASRADISLAPNVRSGRCDACSISAIVLSPVIAIASASVPISGDWAADGDLGLPPGNSRHIIFHETTTLATFCMQEATRRDWFRDCRARCL
jgi:hypothetical protein